MSPWTAPAEGSAVASERKLQIIFPFGIGDKLCHPTNCNNTKMGAVPVRGGRKHPASGRDLQGSMVVVCSAEQHGALLATWGRGLRVSRQVSG